MKESKIEMKKGNKIERKKHRNKDKTVSTKNVKPI